VKLGFTLGVDVPPSPRDLIELVQTGEALGYSSFWLGDHVVIPREVDDAAHRRDVGGKVRIADKSLVDVFEPVVTLSHLCAHVSSIRLGFNVLVIPYRNPVLTAKMLSTLDVLSGGRLMLGAGVGWMQGEFDALGASFADRGAVTDEYLAVMIECWTQEEPSFRGRFYDFGEVAFRPKPIQRPHPPIYIGGNGPPALRRAAAVGQGWLPLFASPEELEPGIARLRELRAANGRAEGECSVLPSVRVRLRPEDDPDGLWSSRDADAIRATVCAYEALGVEELTLVLVEPDLDLALLHDTLRWFAEVLLDPRVSRNVDDPNPRHRSRSGRSA
jgi:probable F420-dependent oxidoreductase